MQPIKNRFCIVKLWPDIQAAEDECIARIRKAAVELGLVCDTVSSTGELVCTPGTFANADTHDFVINLHYDTPKGFDLYSFNALWNPPDFFHEWGFKRCIENLISHDDFLSCDCKAADDLVLARISTNPHFQPIDKRLFHSVSNIAFSPVARTDRKLFYVGINWEALSGSGGRHSKVLKELDKSGRLNIYGPKRFQGINVWEGYKSFVGELPFDGESILEAIHKAGVGLVFSSKAHNDAALMSNRLFETIASGALVLCDDNEFIKRNLGDTVLYVDMNQDHIGIAHDVQNKLDWANDNPSTVSDMIAETQKVFEERFSLKKCISNIYRDIELRKNQLYTSKNGTSVSQKTTELVSLMPTYTEDGASKVVENCMRQIKKFAHHTIIANENFNSNQRKTLQKLCSKQKVKHEIIYADLKFLLSQCASSKDNLGLLLSPFFDDCKSDTIMFCMPGERLFADHLLRLSAALEQNTDADAAIGSFCLIMRDGTLSNVIADCLTPQILGCLAFGQFLIKTSARPQHLAALSNYTHNFSVHSFVGAKNVVLVENVTGETRMEECVSIDYVFLNKEVESLQNNTNHEIIRHSPNSLTDKLFTALPFVKAKTSHNVNSIRMFPSASISTPSTFQWLGNQLRLVYKLGLRARVTALINKIKAGVS